ncbi:hypothetical protein V1291_000830 [Nitrobacteraceae bacterium AZCC 1564]
MTARTAEIVRLVERLTGSDLTRTLSRIEGAVRGVTAGVQSLIGVAILNTARTTFAITLADLPSTRMPRSIEFLANTVMFALPTYANSLSARATLAWNVSNPFPASIV